jgi:uncharacterized protein GlcG (DUF336 family)
MTLTLEEANRILDGALRKAAELNIKISAAVCDAGGRVVVLPRLRSDGRAAKWRRAPTNRRRAALPPPRVAR